MASHKFFIDRDIKKSKLHNGNCTNRINYSFEVLAELLSRSDPVLPYSSFPRSLFVEQAGNAGELLAFEEFEGRAASGGDVGHLVAIAELFYCCC